MPSLRLRDYSLSLIDAPFKSPPSSSPLPLIQHSSPHAHALINVVGQLISRNVKTSSSVGEINAVNCSPLRVLGDFVGVKEPRVPLARDSESERTLRGGGGIEMSKRCKRQREKSIARTTDSKVAVRARNSGILAEARRCRGLNSSAALSADRLVR
jgi:hypothetical protein